MLAYQITNVSRIEVQIFLQFMLFRYQGNMWIFLEMQKNCKSLQTPEYYEWKCINSEKRQLSISC